MSRMVLSLNTSPTGVSADNGKVRRPKEMGKTCTVAEELRLRSALGPLHSENSHV